MRSRHARNGLAPQHGCADAARARLHVAVGADRPEPSAPEPAAPEPAAAVPLPTARRVAARRKRQPVVAKQGRSNGIGFAARLRRRRAGVAVRRSGCGPVGVLIFYRLLRNVCLEKSKKSLRFSFVCGRNNFTMWLALLSRIIA